jgi:hypothetical protein
MNVLQTRCGGLDVHKNSISACICCGMQDECRSTRGVLLPQDLRELAEWLLRHRALFSSALFVTPNVQRDNVFANPAVRAAPRLPFFNYIFLAEATKERRGAGSSPRVLGAPRGGRSEAERLDAAPALGTLSSGKMGSLLLP